MAPRHWLMKAEPDSRIGEKGKDVKFSVDDFESIGTTAWEGVRNYEARNLMKQMKIGDKVLFYHSNCKTPGIAGFAEVCKEAYPDYTAWDPKHPYYDQKTDENNPKWYMVDVKFHARTKHFVPLSLLRHISSLSSSEPPDGLEYIGKSGVDAIKGMALVNRGRLSVQSVEERTWVVIEGMAEKGGWEDLHFGKKKTARSANGEQDDAEEKEAVEVGTSKGKKRKVEADDDGTCSPRRSNRRKSKK